MTPLADIKDGWMHYWFTFTHSVWFVVGFALANIVSAVIYQGLKLLVKAVYGLR